MPRTRTEKLWLGGTGAVAALSVVVGYFFLISPQRAQTSGVQEQVSSARLQGLTLQARITLLTSQAKRLAVYKKALQAAEVALPTSDDLSATPNFLRTLQSIGAATSTSVSSLTVGSPTAVDATAAATTPPAPSSASSSSATLPAAAPAATLYSVAITANVSGSTPGLDAFLKQLQSGQQRAVLVTGVTLAAHSGTVRGRSTLNLTMTAFVRPGTATPVATPSATSTP